MFKPNEQMHTAINQTVVYKEEECKYYTFEYQSLIQTIDANLTNHQATDLFDGKIPS